MKNFKSVLEQLSEAREPGQSSFEVSKMTKEIQKEIKLIEAWNKYYGTKEGKEAYTNGKEMIEQGNSAIADLSDAIAYLERYEDSMGM